MAPKAEEKKRTLPPGHPQAGYTGSDPSAADDGIGTLASSLQEWKDKRQEAYEDEVAAVAEHEDKAAKEEDAAAEKAAAEASSTAETPKTTSKASAST